MSDTCSTRKLVMCPSLFGVLGYDAFLGPNSPSTPLQLVCERVQTENAKICSLLDGRDRDVLHLHCGVYCRTFIF